jgi:peptidyl-prolyl cis-trans isomerase A (cyclophilin A)
LAPFRPNTPGYHRVPLRGCKPQLTFRTSGMPTPLPLVMSAEPEAPASEGVTQMNRTKWLSMLLVVVALIAGNATADAGAAGTKGLLEPLKLKTKAPDVFAAEFETSKGTFVIEVHREWAPRGADRFYSLVSNGYYDGVRFFRVVSGFMAQFGINGDPAVNAAWQPSTIYDDKVTESNTRGMVTFAMRGPDTRTTQIFINYVDNTRLDSMGFAPFGKIIEGMDVVDALYSEYGEGAPRGRGPAQDRIQSEGNAYLEAEFPELDYVKKAVVRVVE